MSASASLAFVRDLIAPPRCAICAAPSEARELLCPGCEGELDTARGGAALVPGVGAVGWSVPYEGAGSGLVAALKFRGALGLAGVAAKLIAARLAEPPDGLTVVAVPAAPLRRLVRGFDPAELIAIELCGLRGLAAAVPLTRASGPRQVGRSRDDRVGDPPRVRAIARSPARVLLVDDVLTTGATLGACRRALVAAGCEELRAAVFARALGDRDAGA
jgi:predicted amidophosphoribosyltransferase